MSYGRGFKGSKYEETKNLDVTDIAKLVRRDLKAEFGKGYKFSVKIERYADGCSLTVYMMAMPEPVPLYNRGKAALEVTNSHGHQAISYRSPEHQALVARMDAVVTAYHYDDSDSMTDYYCVNFHKRIEVDSSLTGPDREVVLAEAKAELEKAEEAFAVAVETETVPTYSGSDSSATTPHLVSDGIIGQRPYKDSAREMLECGPERVIGMKCAGCYCRRPRPRSKFCSQKCAARWAEEMVAGLEWCSVCDIWSEVTEFGGQCGVCHNPVAARRSREACLDMAVIEA